MAPMLKDPDGSLRGSLKKHLPATIFIIILVGFLLRVLFLDHVLQSSDNAWLASRIASDPGYGWMWSENFGMLLNLVLKLWAAALSALGITLTEIHWKLPVAILGSLQVPLLFFFLRRLGCSVFASWSGAAMAALLPIHVMWSRFPRGHEVLGVFFCTIALWALLRFLQAPDRRSGFLASLAIGLYLVSHGYILPFFPSFLVALLLFPPQEESSWLTRIRSGIALCLKHRVWLFPLLFSPLCLYPLAHTFFKKTRPGFFLDDHFPGLLADTGTCFLALLLLATAAFGLKARLRRLPAATLLGFMACAYLAPLFLGTPPGVTIVRDYLLLGIYFWMVFAIVILDQLLTRSTLGRIFWLICLACTLWGNVNQFFLRGRGWDPSLIQVGRGALDPDPGSKAAGYLIQKHFPRDATLLVLHRNIEPPNLLYYFRRREISFYDLDLAQSHEAYLANREKADAVIADREQAAWISGDPRFVLRIVLHSQSEARLWLFSRRGIPFQELESDTAPFNRLFDREFSWRVSLF